ncbi:MAG: PEP-CTERM sorting domain-containing protein [Thermoguttaceae bacterium]
MQYRNTTCKLFRAFFTTMTVAGLLTITLALPTAAADYFNWESDPISEQPESLLQGVLDQSQTTSSGGGNFGATRFFAQTFTAGMSGQLAHVDLKTFLFPDHPSVPATISLVQTVNGIPNGTVLGAVVVPSLNDGWNAIDFMDENVLLSSGTLYGIVLSNGPSPTDPPNNYLNIQWHDNHYPQGELWQWTPGPGWERFNPFGPIGDADAAFQTWMVPEPSTLVLLGMGAAVLAFFVRRRKSVTPTLE